MTSRRVGRRARHVFAVMATATVLALMLAGAGPADAQIAPARPAEKLVVGVTAAGAPAGGILLAQDHGLFRDEGLDVELLFMSTAALSLPALLSNQVQVVTGVAGPPPVAAALGGADIVWLAELLGTMPYTLVVGPAVTRAAELRGKRIGVSRFGTSSHFAARFALARLGLDPDRDATFLPVGDSAVRLAALASGGIDASVMPPEALPTVARLKLRSLIDTRALGLRYPQEGIVATRAFVAARPDTVRRFLRAVLTGTQRFKASRAEGLQLLRKHVPFRDDESVAANYDGYAPMILVKPYVSAESIQLILDDMAAKDPRARSFRPERLMEMRFVRELDEAGFIDRLYGR